MSPAPIYWSRFNGGSEAGVLDAVDGRPATPENRGATNGAETVRQRAFGKKPQSTPSTHTSVSLTSERLVWECKGAYG